VSFFILGVSGLAINTILVKYYNVSVLGMFNLLITILVVAGHFSVGGVHYSVLKYNSHIQHDSKLSSEIVSSGLFLTLSESFIVVIVLYFLAPYLEKVFKTSYLEKNIILMLPGLIFFSLNKVYLMSCNGLNFMRAYAVLNAMRYIFLLSYILLFYFIRLRVSYFGCIISFSEFTLLIINIVYFHKYISLLRFPEKKWLKRHFLFGIKGLWGGALYDTNMRIDILVIGHLLSDKAIGIYSFASMIGEGFAQLNLVLKNNVDPIFGNAIFKKDTNVILETIAKVRKRYFPIIIVAGTFLILIYPFVFKNILKITPYVITESWHVLSTLLFFIMFASFFWPFTGLLNQKGRPEISSLVILISVVLNIILNFIMIPVLGIIGAAIATGLVFLFQSGMLYFWGKKIVFASKNLRERI